jgi:hypothetical protein
LDVIKAHQNSLNGRSGRDFNSEICNTRHAECRQSAGVIHIKYTYMHTTRLHDRTLHAASMHHETPSGKYKYKADSKWQCQVADPERKTLALFSGGLGSGFLRVCVLGFGFLGFCFWVWVWVWVLVWNLRATGVKSTTHHDATCFILHAAGGLTSQ